MNWGKAISLIVITSNSKGFCQIQRDSLNAGGDNDEQQICCFVITSSLGLPSPMFVLVPSTMLFLS